MLSTIISPWQPDLRRTRLTSLGALGLWGSFGVLIDPSGAPGRHPARSEGAPRPGNRNSGPPQVWSLVHVKQSVCLRVLHRRVLGDQIQEIVNCWVEAGLPSWQPVRMGGWLPPKNFVDAFPRDLDRYQRFGGNIWHRSGSLDDRPILSPPEQ